MKNSTTPVFLLASERSGTNLLRKLITQHQDVYFGPSPAHFLSVLYFSSSYYGTLEKDENFLLLIEDALKLCYVHFSPWSIDLNSEFVFKKYVEAGFSERNIIFLSHLLMEIYAQSQGYQTYFCKDNNVFDYVFEILYYLPTAKFIYLYRDSRDYAVSQYKRSLQTDSIVRIANLWKEEQVKCITAYSLLKKNQVMKISYEDLVQNSEAKIKEICNFLAVDFVEAKQVEIMTGTTEEWENLGKPVIKNNFNKYEQALKRTQIKLIESITKNQMEYLGYPFRYDVREFPRIIKILEFFWGHLKFRVRRKFLKKKNNYKANFERSTLIHKLNVKG